MSMENSKNKFTNRDWIFIIIIISLIQGLIWYASFINARNSSALNYVSFAGTLISIILAVLAIGYTYGESISEKNKSQTISNQIQTLNEVIKTIQVETSSLDKISTINDELLHLSNVFSQGLTETHQRVENVNLSVQKFLKDYDKYSREKEIVPNTIDKSTLARLLISARNPLFEISLLTLYSLNNKEIPNIALGVRASISKTITKAKELIIESKIESPFDYEQLFIGSTLSVHTVFTGAGLIQKNEKSILFDDTLIAVINDVILPNLSKTGEFYQKVRELIISNLK